MRKASVNSTAAVETHPADTVHVDSFLHQQPLRFSNVAVFHSFKQLRPPPPINDTYIGASAQQLTSRSPTSFAWFACIMFRLTASSSATESML